jgi:hypothetical protein
MAFDLIVLGGGPLAILPANAPATLDFPFSASRSAALAAFASTKVVFPQKRCCIPQRFTTARRTAINTALPPKG